MFLWAFYTTLFSRHFVSVISYKPAASFPTTSTNFWQQAIFVMNNPTETAFNLRRLSVRFESTLKANEIELFPTGFLSSTEKHLKLCFFFLFLSTEGQSLWGWLCMQITMNNYKWNRKTACSQLVFLKYRSGWTLSSQPKDLLARLAEWHGVVVDGIGEASTVKLKGRLILGYLPYAFQLWASYFFICRNKNICKD